MNTLVFSLKNWVFRGLVILVAVAGGWAYWAMHIKYVALEHRLNLLQSLSIVTPEPVASFAGQGLVHGTLDTRVQELDRRLMGLQKKVDLLTQQLERSAVWQGAASVSTDLAHRTTDPIESNKRSPLEPPQKTQFLSEIDRADELWGVYNQEIRANEWAFSVEATIQSAFNNVSELANVRIRELDCRTTMCRLTWELAEGLSSEDRFILENEMVAALGAAGLTQGTQIENGNEIEGFFFRNNTQPAPLQRED